MANWNDATIQEFQSKAGKGVGPFGDQPMLLTTVGARGGNERTSPVMYSLWARLSSALEQRSGTYGCRRASS